ncbi:MAG: hypothetical protein M2R45_00597 [Verrucomicrobia subdivision 3 bacterium]|nr:hypothetical protein [Limisphaerales bacterium]MCS1417812.1 hypothetical protein [Limisphaerales bacterium]
MAVSPCIKAKTTDFTPDGTTGLICDGEPNRTSVRSGPSLDVVLRPSSGQLSLGSRFPTCAEVIIMIHSPSPDSSPIKTGQRQRGWRSMGLPPMAPQPLHRRASPILEKPSKSWLPHDGQLHWPKIRAGSVPGAQFRQFEDRFASVTTAKMTTCFRYAAIPPQCSENSFQPERLTSNRRLNTAEAIRQSGCQKCPASDLKCRSKVVIKGMPWKHQES